MINKPWIHQEDFDYYVVKVDSDSRIYVSKIFWDAVIVARAVEKFRKAMNDLEKFVNKLDQKCDH